ncbi:unnamed protein product, partial [marine sediment metagenome]
YINNEDIILLIVGKPARDYNMQKVKDAIRNDSRIILREHFIADEDIQFYYKASDIVCLPYQKIYNSAVLKHSFSFGSVCVLSDLEEFSSFAKDMVNCSIFDRNSPKDLAEKIKKVIKDKQLYKRLSQNSKEYSNKHWDWHNCAIKTKKVYDLF